MDRVYQPSASSGRPARTYAAAKLGHQDRLGPADLDLLLELRQDLLDGGAGPGKREAVEVVPRPIGAVPLEDARRLVHERIVLAHFPEHREQPVAELQ